ncbi:MAG: hypothetical protein M1834_008273 [Cirrosporium novae-zelandiae]|nr:MAG: hypothetical protein M1834_008273 [Cirrosporium novae-zelandiae]
MGTAFSPHHDSPITLHFPSPQNIHSVDATAALRRLLSRSPSPAKSPFRSPSKGHAFRLVTSGSSSTSTSPSPKSPLSHVLHSPGKGGSNIFASISPHSPISKSYSSGAKAGRPTLRRTQAMRPNRSRTSPKSPTKRPLTDLSDRGNATPKSPIPLSKGDENRIARSGSPIARRSFERELKAFSASDGEHHHRTLTKRSSTNLSGFSMTQSPLRRSDGIMNLDQCALESPNPKRRSVHGATFGSNFNVFDSEAMRSSPESSQEYDGQDVEMSPAPPNLTTTAPPLFAPIPSRSSSLRKSTLQQRYHEKPNFRAKFMESDFGTPPQSSKSRPRIFDTPASRESPFTTPTTQNLFLPPLTRSKPFNEQSSAHPHPLSRTITQTSSSSSIVDDSPTHEPVHKPVRPQGKFNFSKSLPLGATRPFFRDVQASNSPDSSFETPANYKLVKPLPAAFMSTGLISKKNRNVEELVGAADSTGNMPDTPCKRPVHAFPLPPQPIPGSTFRKSYNLRHAFGTPSTPFNGHMSTATPAAFGRGVSIFGGSISNGNANRRSSFLSISGDERSDTPSLGDRQSSADYDLPPTPTKLPFSQEPRSQPIHHYQDALVQADLSNTTQGHSFSTAPSRKYLTFSIGTPSGSVDEDSDGVMEDSPSATLRLKSSQSKHSTSFAQSRLLKTAKSPPSDSAKFLTTPLLRIQTRNHTKRLSLSPASPLYERFHRRSPHTPQDNMAPPDPSGLSISGHDNDFLSRPATRGKSSTASFPPATPTGPRDYFSQIGKRSLAASLNGLDTPDVDASMTSRFDKVEIIGTGEFSQVYRVSKKPAPSSGSSPQAPLSDRVWAVKKSKNPYTGNRDRQHKLREVQVLKVLGQSDHTVHLIDSWEDKGHLYIQTEYCEEGSLDMFLTQVGLKARLDDFRIWKILLELSLGLKHIHDSGFIHLDLKPANVLVTFEGVLKIGDFGMATTWPAPPGIEGEGDREYIGPEILRGEFDKPADVFALGLIMLEIAGNVELPDNGASWQKLRSGDMSDVPSLTWSSEVSNIPRDPSGNPLTSEANEDAFSFDFGDDEFASPKIVRQRSQKMTPVKYNRPTELVQPPSFMTNPDDTRALDHVVRWMIAPEPSDRPVISQVLQTDGVVWAETRRRAGATIFEGNWGPADEALQDDAEMIDV